MTDETWTVKHTLDWCVEYLERHGDEHPRRSAEWLMSAATGLSRVEVYAYWDKPLSEEERTTLREGLRRRAAGEPLQYVTGEVGFRHIVLRTARGVLIPRPETEVLVQVVLDALPQLPMHGERVEEEQGATQASEQVLQPSPGEGAERTEGAAAADTGGNAAEDAESTTCAAVSVRPCHRVLEVGCGTGCIALSLAKEGGCQVVATDVSEEAVACATRNAEALALRDALDVVQTDCTQGVKGRFDVLVSNPPYIPTEVMGKLDAEVVGYEPHLALDGGADGLDFFRRLLVVAPELLVPGGLMACELHETCLDAAAALMGEAGFAHVCITPDLAGKPRVITGRR